jgi:adenine deaminase
MNFPGVIYDDPNVLKKLGISKKYNKKIDGHAPNVRGELLDKYINAGITTDHECFDIEEALEKIKKGMIIQIREGSAAKNFETLYKLIDQFPDSVMLCSDDLHPDDLTKGHINLLIKRALSKGLDFFNVIRTCTYNVVKHYGIHVGLLQKNDPADFIVVDNINDFNILATYCNGVPVFQNNKSLINNNNKISINNFARNKISLDDIMVNKPSDKANINVISVIDGELITKLITSPAKTENNHVVQDIENDILKIVVINRYDKKSIPTVGFIKNFGLKNGAIATSVAHDSHNIVAVGANDIDLINAINEIISNKGGLSISENENTYSLKLEIGGIMTNKKANYVAQKYNELDTKVKQMGSKLRAPFMTLSFMSLLVIPEIKISDKYLFDSLHFKAISIFNNQI